MMRGRRLLLLLITLTVGGCASQQPPAPPPRPAPAPAPVRPAPPPPPVSQPIQAPPATGWQDLPLTPGSWTYDGEPRLQASYGSSQPGFILRCVLQSRQVQLLRPGTTTGNTMVIQTSEARRALPLSITQDGSATPYASLSTEDPLLDNIVFSRGRFSIEMPGMPMLLIPSWPEPARVVEECRR